MYRCTAAPLLLTPRNSHLHRPKPFVDKSSHWLQWHPWRVLPCWCPCCWLGCLHAASGRVRGPCCLLHINLYSCWCFDACTIHCLPLYTRGIHHWHCWAPGSAIGKHGFHKMWLEAMPATRTALSSKLNTLAATGVQSCSCTLTCRCWCVDTLPCQHAVGMDVYV